jgi:hypothetical protein
MTTTPELDRSILAAQEQVYNNEERVVDPLDRTYARALVAELLRGMEQIPQLLLKDTGRGYAAALAEIRRRAGLEGEG